MEYKEGIFVGYRGYEKNKVKPLFPFGFGLSYTTFRFSNLNATQSVKDGELQVTASFDVANTGTKHEVDAPRPRVTPDPANRSDMDQRGNTSVS